MKKMNNLGICLIASAIMAIALVFGFKSTYEAQAAQTCANARCHVYINKCLPGHEISLRPRCSYTACIHGLGCTDPIID